MIKHIKDSYIGLKREEKDGSYFCIPEVTQFPIFINSTAYQIFMLSDNNTTEGIIEEMQKRYPKISRKRLEKDVTDILWYLYNIGIVTKPDVIKEKSLTNYNPNKLCILDESDYLPAYNYVQSIIKNYDKNVCHISLETRGLPIEEITMFYDLPQMRMRSVMGRERYFQLRDVNGAIKVILGISVHKVGRVIYVESLFSEEWNLAIEALNLILNYHNIIGYEKLKLGISTAENKFVQRLLGEDYLQEGILSAEARDGDVVILSKTISSK